MTSKNPRCPSRWRPLLSNGEPIGSILLNIHEVWPRPFWGGSSHQKENTVYHLIGHIPFASLEGDKRPDKINQKSGEFEHFMP